MSLLESEGGKRRLLGIEIPGIEHYNVGRDPEYRIRLKKHNGGLILAYALKPGNNIFLVETRLGEQYPVDAPITRIVSELAPSPHQFPGRVLCMWRQTSKRNTHKWDPSRFTSIFAVQATWRWLACYELWMTTGQWPIPEATA